ncbi:hypothetical protein OsI_03969 [Oryza sativa Indica Group]|uniref:Uncharacterized protein n=1 Tax=Oryza sativa subsp. indica TaxID=39946 RepID=A2WVP5_ORYSI|nr:hypothetical protein OsI_03969 [Oryza sativa Indica Group]
MEANASVDIDDQHVCLKISNQESTTSMFRSHKQRHLVRLTDAQLALRQDASTFGETIGSAQDVKFDAKTLTQAHRYVLRHLDEIEDFRREFLEEEKRKQKKSVFTSFESDKLINERFHDWLYHKRKFAIDGRAKSWLLHQLDGKWRQYKGKLKGKYYKPNLPMERVLQTVPNTVDESRWPTLVSYWYSKDSKKISDRNQENALKHPHTLGRKSFTRKRKELEVNGVEVDRETFFDECHKTKDGRYVTDATQEKMNEVYMKLAEKRVDSQQLTEADFEQAMLDMFGKDHSGRVRGMGPTITPTNYYGGRFLNISAINEQGTSSKKYPEDNLLARLPPSLTRLIPTSEVNQNQEVQAPNTAPSPSQRASSQPSTEEE